MNVVVPGQGRVISFFGEDAQSLQCCEECGELIQAVSKMRRAVRSGKDGSEAYDNLVEEIADVLVVLEQMKTMYNIHDHEIQGMVDQKCARLEARMHEPDRVLFKR